MTTSWCLHSTSQTRPSCLRVSAQRIARHDVPVTNPAPTPASVEDEWGILTTWVNAHDEPEQVAPAQRRSGCAT